MLLELESASTRYIKLVLRCTAELIHHYHIEQQTSTTARPSTMKFVALVLALVALVTAQYNATQMYKLKTIVKGGAKGKEAFNDLYLYSSPSSSNIFLTC